MPTQSITSKVKYVISTLRKRAIREADTFYGNLVIPLTAIHRGASYLETSMGQEGRSKLNGRFERGLAMAHKSTVSPYQDPFEPSKERQYQVQSSDPNKPPYLVDLQAGTCECLDHWKGNFCKHLVAASIIEGALKFMGRLEVLKPPVTEITPLPPTPQGESIIWAAMRYNDVVLGVEVMNLDGEMATVRALPVIKDDKKLQPQFPFEGKTSLAIVPKKHLFHVRIFQ